MLRDLNKTCERCGNPPGKDCFRPQFQARGELVTLPCDTPPAETVRLWLQAVKAGL